MTNPRYKHFQQEDFTAGDYEQFVTYLSEHKQKMKPDERGITTDSSLFDKLFEHERWNWSKYRYGVDPFSTFEYIYNNFKKGMYVQIIDNKVNIMLPFSNVDFKNKYTEELQINTTKFHTFEEMYKKICQFEGRHYVPNKVSWFKDKWYCNNGLVRYEYPIKENDSGINMIKDMLTTLCEKRIVPDCEFFIHKRDFPLLSLHGYDPYTALVPENTKMTGIKDYFLPVLSMCSRHDLADIPVPTWEDWCRASYQYDKRVFSKANKEYPIDIISDWDKKKPTIVFRGSSTGLGTTVNTNPRFFFSKLSQYSNQYWEDGTPLLDIGITKWNIRPRKQYPTDYLDIPNPTEMEINLISSLTMYEQSEYRYILHLPGHSCAYRLSQELGMMSVIFLYPFDYHLWFFPLLKPFVHYIPLVKGFDEHEIFEKIRWCEENPEKAQEIAKNAFEFYNTYLTMDSILDFLQNVFVRLAKKMKYHEVHYYKLSYNNLYDNICIPPPTGLIDITNEIVIKETKNTRVYRSGDKWLIKEKDSDMRHSFFISHVLQHNLQNLTPNFMYSSYISTNQLIMTYEKNSLDITLETYLKSENFTFKEFKNILCQIIFTLQMSQLKIGFIHYDLTPWNIVLLNNYSKKIIYPFYNSQKILKTSKYLVKIIDFEYAHVYYKEKSVHNIMPFFLSEDHDILTLVYNSFSTILKHQKCLPNDIKWIEKILYYCTDHHFMSIREMKLFLMDERKFSRILLTNEKKPRKNVMDHILQTLKTVYVDKMDVYHDWIFLDNECDISPLTLHTSTDHYTQLLYIYKFQKYLQTLDDSFQEIENSKHLYHLRSEYQKIGQNIIFSTSMIIKKLLKHDCSHVRWYPFITDSNYIPHFEFKLVKKALLIMYLSSYMSDRTKNDAQSYLLELTNE